MLATEVLNNVAFNNNPTPNSTAKAMIKKSRFTKKSLLKTTVSILLGETELFDLFNIKNKQKNANKSRQTKDATVIIRDHIIYDQIKPSPFTPVSPIRLYITLFFISKKMRRTSPKLDTMRAVRPAAKKALLEIR